MIKGLNSNAKLFANDTLLSSVAHDPAVTKETLNEDLTKISQWDYQWEKIFSPKPLNQAEEIVFLRKNRATNYVRISFNKMIIKRESDLNPVFPL